MVLVKRMGLAERIVKDWNTLDEIAKLIKERKDDLKKDHKYEFLKDAYLNSGDIAFLFYVLTSPIQARRITLYFI